MFKGIIPTINKYDDEFSNFGIFKILDYDLNLDERTLKFKKYDRILCEDCNQEIKSSNFVCYNCYNKETDCNEQNRMNYGICKSCFKSNSYNGCCKIKIFETLDYDLNLGKRGAKYKNFVYISCKECNKEIDKIYYYCTNCYSKETDINKKGLMKFGLNFGIFNTSDYYNINLEERKAKYKDFYGILCEKCNKEIYKPEYYCTNCYNTETDIIIKSHMKYGSNFVIFNTSDYNLNLEERKAKYKDFDGILCEKCNEEIYKRKYYCTNCYNAETDIIIKGQMKCESNYEIFNTSDYNLYLGEREAKYGEYGYLLCEKCNKEIYKPEYYCTNCYNTETDNIIKGHMKYGSNYGIFNTSDYNLNLEKRKAKYKDFDIILCEKCYKEIHKWVYYCTNCCFLFRISDHNLNMEERKAKYEEYDHVLCEKCKVEIDREYYNCVRCYNNSCKICFIGDNDNCCLFNEFKQYLKKFIMWISEINDTDYYILKEQKVGISDYDLSEDDRLVKYKDFDYILCEKCGINYLYNYCYDCYIKKINELNELKSILQPTLQNYKNFYYKIYNEETKELRELKELQSILEGYKNVYFNLDANLGIFKQIIQKFEDTKNRIESRKILINNIRYNGVNNCNLKLRSYCGCYDREIDINEKKRMEFGKCKECLKIHEDLDGCLSCNPKRFQRDFDKWTSRNEVIDKLIQDNQLLVRRHGLLEWIPYDKFININYIAEGGFAKVYSATWIDGQIKKWSQFSNSWKRNGSTSIALKVLNNSENISEDFLNEVRRKESKK
jgi:hypothetical protein